MRSRPTTAQIKRIATQVEAKVATASPEALRRMLHEVETGDCYRETVQETLAQRGKFVDPLGRCPDLDPSLSR